MDLFDALPALRKHDLFGDKKVSLVGVSTIVHDRAAYYFEVGKPKFWSRREDGVTGVGIGGIGGKIERGEGVWACLRREAREELGVRVRLELPDQTYLLNEWRVVDQIHLKPSKKRPIPLIVILMPPRLGGPLAPDHLAILAFKSRLRGQPAPHDLLGLLRVKNEVLIDFFAREDWPLAQAQTLPGVTMTLNGELPANTVLRPKLTAHAFQCLVQHSLPF